jgi:hypothetical protein
MYSIVMPLPPLTTLATDEPTKADLDPTEKAVALAITYAAKIVTAADFIVL